MRLLLHRVVGIFLLLLLTFYAKGQGGSDTIFFNKKWKPCAHDTATFFRPPPPLVNGLFAVHDFFMSGQLQMNGMMSSLSPEIREGIFLYYDSKGRLTAKEKFLRNQPIDTFSFFRGNKLFEQRIHNIDTSWVYQKFFDTSTGFLIREGGTLRQLESGDWRYYSKGGRLRRIGNYENGRIQGCTTSYDTLSGATSVESVYMDDSLLHRSFYTPSGKLFKDFHFRDERPEGVSYDYDTLTGYPRDMSTYANGILNGQFITYSPNCGQVNFSGYLLKGKLNGKSNYYYNCSDKRFASFTWDFGKRDGHSEMYDKRSGNMIAAGDFYRDLLEGEWKYFYPDKTETIRAIKHFSKGQLNDTLKSWWPNGKIRRRETYKSGTLDTWQCFSKEGKDTIYYPYYSPPSFLKEPQYYIDHWAEYPESQKADFVVGKVKVEIIVAPDGNITFVKALESTNSLFEEEAVRICYLLPVVSAGMEEGTPAITSVFYTLSFSPPE